MAKNLTAVPTNIPACCVNLTALNRQVRNAREGGLYDGGFGRNRFPRNFWGFSVRFCWTGEESAASLQASFSPSIVVYQRTKTGVIRIRTNVILLAVVTDERAAQGSHARINLFPDRIKVDRLLGKTRRRLDQERNPNYQNGDLGIAAFVCAKVCLSARWDCDS